MKQRFLSCVVILCLLMTLPAISGAKDMGTFPDLRIVVNEAQQKNLNRMRAQAEYDAIHHTNRQNYIARSWTSSNGDVYTMQFNKEQKPLCELVSFSDSDGNSFYLTFEELPWYCVTYILWIEDAVSKKITTNLSFQLCWPSYYVWNQNFEWNGQRDGAGNVPLEFRNFACVSPDELMNSTQWCKTFVESYGVGASLNSDGTNWEYLTMLPNKVLGFQSMANGELGYTTISDKYASTIKFNSLEEQSHTVSLNQDIYFTSLDGQNYTLSNSPQGTARIEGFVKKTENLPSFGNIHIFNMGLGGNGVSGFNNLYPEEWGPLSQFYFIAADEYINIQIPESMKTLQPDDINMILDFTGEEYEKHSNCIKGVLYADPKYSEDSSLNPMEEFYKLILPSTDSETNQITIAPEKNSFVPYGVGDNNGVYQWSERNGTSLRLHNFLTYLGEDASMAFGTTNGYRFSGTDYYGNIINAQSNGKCIYHYDPTDVHKTREFSLTGTIDFDNPVTPTPINYYIIGSDINGHSWELGQPDAIFTQISDNLYRWTGKQLGSGFKINDGTWDNLEVNYGSNGSPLVLAEPYYYELGELADNIYIDQYPVIINPEVTLDIYNGTITVTGTPQGEYKYEWYITGLASGDDNQFADRFILAPVNGQQNIFRAKNVIIDKNGDFKVCNDGYTNQYGLRDFYDEINDNNLSAQLAPQPVNINGMPFDLHGTYDITWNLNSEYITFVKVSDNTTPDQPKVASLIVNTQNGPGMKTTVSVGTSVSIQFDLDDYWSITGCTVNGEYVTLPIEDNSVSIVMDADKTLDIELSYTGTLEWIEGVTGVAYFEGTDLTIAVNEDGGVTVSGLNIGDEIVIYSLAGQIVERHFATATQETCHPEPGIYIVRVNNLAAKITVR